MAIFLAVAALAVSLVSALFSFLAVRAAARSADAAKSSDRRARAPQLAVSLDHPTPAPDTWAIYRVRNDGPQDLDDVVVYRPRARAPSHRRLVPV
ncbi:MAG: hypothetical protein ACYCYA_14730 [Actinomycetes bacterium]